jgi:WD40-like Beta Propeller Repeat
MRVRHPTIAAILLAALGLAGCERRREERPLVYSEPIGHLGRGYRKNSLAVSHDHRRMAWIEERAGQCRAVVDGRKGRPLAICLDPLFSRDGAAYAYWGVPDPGWPPKGYLYADGNPSTTAAGRDGPFVFSRDGGRWAAIAPAYDRDAPPFSRAEVQRARGAGDTGEEADAEKKADEDEAEPAEDGTKKDDQTDRAPPQRLVAFTARGALGEYRDATSPALSPDGSHVAFIASSTEGEKRLIVDGEVRRVFGPPEVPYLPVLKPTPEKPGPHLEPEFAVRFLVDGSLVVLALAEQGWTVFHDDDIWATYAAVQIPKTGYEVIDPTLLSKRTIVAGSMVEAAAAPVACWWERMEGDAERWRVACNGEPIDDRICDYPFPDVPIAPAADGRSAAYVCRRNAPLNPDGTLSGPPVLWVIAAGEELGPHQFLWGVDLSADGRHYAYAAADTLGETWFYVVDGQRYDGPWQQAFPPKLSPDGSAVVWAAGREEESERLDLVLNGDIVARADLVMAPPLFDGNRKVQWAVRRGGSVRRVVACTRWAPLPALRRLACW